MTKTLAFFDRLLVFILGILLLCFGFIPLTYFWDIPYVSEWTQQVDPAVIGNLPYRSWYNTALIVGAVVLAIVGLWAVIANVRSRGFSTREITAADAEHGTTEINVKRVAEAACHHLATNPMINSADTKVAMVETRPTIEFVAVANPAFSLDEVATVLEEADQDFRMANHTMNVDTLWKLHYDQVSA